MAMAREGTAAPAAPSRSDPHGRARAYWRHQLVLSLLAAAVVAGALVVLAAAAPAAHQPVSELRMGVDGRVVVAHPADDALRSLMWPAVAGAAAVTSVLGALVVHTVRVATFTFRRGDR